MKPTHHHLLTRIAPLLSALSLLVAPAIVSAQSLPDSILNTASGQPGGEVFVQGDDIFVVFGDGAGPVFSGDPSTSEGWYFSSWFGFYNTNQTPWVYHDRLGWIYPGTTDSNDFLYYDLERRSWVYTSSSLYPLVYEFSSESYQVIDTGLSNPGSRVQYSL